MIMFYHCLSDDDNNNDNNNNHYSSESEGWKMERMQGL